MDQQTSQSIHVPFPSGDGLQLRISMGPAQLRIAPGAGAGDWLTGTYVDPTGGIPLQVDQSGTTAHIHQKVGLKHIPRPRGNPVLDLRLGGDRPYMLIIEGGANQTEAELGGLPLTRFECRMGAGQTKIRFSAPNPAAMDRLQLSAGAAELTFAGLGHANAAEIAIEGGAAAFKLDFSGPLQRNCDARINVGVAGLEIIVPSSTAARIRAKTTLGGVDVGDGFQTREGGYWTSAAVAGETPLLMIEGTVALAGIKLRST